jgi:hypothetical protein
MQRETLQLPASLSVVRDLGADRRLAVFPVVRGQGHQAGLDVAG